MKLPLLGWMSLIKIFLKEFSSYRWSVASFFRLSSVCKRWKSVVDSATFRLAFSDAPSREPWFYMVSSHQLSRRRSPVVYDSSEENWKVLGCPFFLRPEPENEDSFCNFVPVVASGGLLCFHSESDSFVVSKMELVVLSTLKWSRMQTVLSL
nr:F-box only protein 13 [Ipomoea batatas]